MRKINVHVGFIQAFTIATLMLMIPLFIVIPVFGASIGSRGEAIRPADVNISGLKKIGSLNLCATEMHIADLDMDGNPELIVGCNRMLSVYHFTSFDTVSLACALNIDGVTWGIQDITTGDTDNDGQLEIVVCAGGAHDVDSAGQVRIYEYTGNSLNLAWQEIIGEYVESAAVGNCDLDPYKEIVVGVSWYGQELKLYKTNGSNNYTEFASAYIGSDVRRVLVDDVDGDGLKDIIVGTGQWNDYMLRVYKYENATTWNLLWSKKMDAVVFSIDVADFNNNGINDIIIGTFYQHNIIRIYEKSGSDLNRIYGIEIEDEVKTLKAGDLDSNGFPEAVVGTQNSLMTITYVNGQFYNWSLPSPEVCAVQIFDVDNDNVPEIYAGLIASEARIDIFHPEPVTLTPGNIDNDNPDLIYGMTKNQLYGTITAIIVIAFFLVLIIVIGARRSKKSKKTKQVRKKPVIKKQVPPPRVKPTPAPPFQPRRPVGMQPPPRTQAWPPLEQRMPQGTFQNLQARRESMEVFERQKRFNEAWKRFGELIQQANRYKQEKKWMDAITSGQAAINIAAKFKDYNKIRQSRELISDIQKSWLQDLEREFQSLASLIANMDFKTAIDKLQRMKLEAEQAHFNAMVQKINNRIENTRTLEILSKLLKSAKRIKIEDLCVALGKTRAETLELVIDWSEVFNVKLDGEFVVVDDTADFSDFISNLDAQFVQWGEKEITKQGKLMAREYQERISSLQGTQAREKIVDYFCMSCNKNVPIDAIQNLADPRCPSCKQSLSVVLNCPKCHQAVAITSVEYHELKGTPINCPNCGHQFPI
ncbi:MAG: FG-GAP-like repeat-containing protein [Promethearchaeota archaeon]